MTAVAENNGSFVLDFAAQQTNGGGVQRRVLSSFLTWLEANGYEVVHEEDDPRSTDDLIAQYFESVKAQHR